jgi:hypothetical protein
MAPMMLHFARRVFPGAIIPGRLVSYYYGDVG